MFDLVSENIGIAQSMRVPENSLKNAFLDSLEDGICGFWFIEKILSCLTRQFHQAHKPLYYF